MSLLQDHMNSIEKLLLSKSNVARNSGHPLHKGNARENFVKEFLKNHIGDTVKIGTGEIISVATESNDKRNQFDLILYNSSFPKINFSTSVDAFLVESVNTTIEIKSKLTKKELEKAISAANNVKNMKRTVKKYLNTKLSFQPRLYSFLVAYDGPKKISTVHNWLIDIEKNLNINQSHMPVDSKERALKISEALDFIVVLGIGIIAFDNLPITVPIPDDLKRNNPEYKRFYIQQDKDNILSLFIFLVDIINGIRCDEVDLNPYYSKLGERHVMWGE